MEKIHEDWDKVKKRWEAWWSCEMYDRPLIQAYAPKEVKTIDDMEIIKADGDPKTKWSNQEHILKRGKVWVQNTYFGGEAMPILNPNWSVGHTCYFGCEPDFQENTVWVHPFSCENNGYPELRFEEIGYWWNWYNNFIEKVVREGEDKFYLQPQFGNSAADTLAMIRDSQELMYDMAENPEWVQNSVNIVTDVLLETFEKLWKKIDKCNMDGYTNWNNCWSPGKTLIVDADISGMISPKQFNEIFLPSIIRQMATVSYTQFHVDGEAIASAHLDTLLSLKELLSFQWVPGDGKNEIMQWVPLIKKIQDKKKALLIYTRPDEILPLLKEIRPEGLCISTYCSSESDARKLIGQVEKLYKGTK